MSHNLRFGATLLVLGATVAVAKFHAGRAPASLAFPLSSIERQILGWTGVDDPPPPDYILKSLAATSLLSRTYRRGSSEMNLWIAYYANQQAGETMHSPKYCVPGTGWEFIEQEAAPLATTRGTVSVNDYVLIRSGERLRMLYWYQGRRRVVASEYVGKLALMWDAFRYGQTSGSIVRLTLPDGDAGRADGLAFASALVAQMDRCFGD